MLTVDIATLNAALEDAGFNGELVAQTESKFIVGYVKTATPHPDSDHLLVTETVVDNDQSVQIVSGSPNMQADIKVVVAKVGAMMPNGLIIWPGALRGLKTGCLSGRELRLAAPNDQVPWSSLTMKLGTVRLWRGQTSYGSKNA